MMNSILRVLTLVGFVLLVGIANAQQVVEKAVEETVEISDAERGEFVKLFDGETLEGWEGKADWFRVQDGAIVAGTQEKDIPQNEFLCTTREYKNFDLILKAKLVGEGNNAGIQFRSVRIPNHHEMIGFQCDMGSNDERLIWGSLYDESRRKKFLAHGEADAVREAFRENDWNEFRVRCEGSRIQIWLNGIQTVDYTETQDDIAESGLIGLQIHSGKPAEAMYTDISIHELPDAAE